MGINYEVTIPGASEPVHLGKMSAGWVFLFRAQPQWNPADAFSSWVLLATMGTVQDEYGNEIEFQKLLQDIMYSYQRTGAQRATDDPRSPVFENHGFVFCESEFC